MNYPDPFRLSVCLSLAAPFGNRHSGQTTVVEGCVCSHRAGRWRKPPAAGWDMEPPAAPGRPAHSGGLEPPCALAPAPSAPAPRSPPWRPSGWAVDAWGGVAGPVWGSEAWERRVGRRGWRKSKAHCSGSGRKESEKRINTNINTYSSSETELSFSHNHP